MKSDKGKKVNEKPGKKTAGNADHKLVSKSKKNLKEEEDDFEDDEITPTSLSGKNGKPSISKKGKAKDDEEEDEDVKDDWEKPEEEEDWDPDFDEFDIPKSKGAKGKKVTGGTKKADDDDIKLDDEFKEMDLFDDRFDDDGDDDY